MMHSSADNFFTPAEQEQICQAVAKAEVATSGEIATMVVARSDRYREAAIVGSLLVSATLSLVIAVASQHVTIWSYLPLMLTLYFPCFWLIKRGSFLQRPFIAGSHLEEAVKSRAIRAFYEKGLYRTRHETGILIFISIFERKVWILGDRGINARIPEETWQQLVRTLTAGIMENRACDALCEVIRRSGEELTRFFPREADDTNELQDEILTER